MDGLGGNGCLCLVGMVRVGVNAEEEEGSGCEGALEEEKVIGLED